METYQITLLIIGAVLLVGVGVAWFFEKDYLKYANTVNPIVSLVAQVVRGISGMFPNNGLLKELAIVLDAAIKATADAEQLWLSGALQKNERPAHAENYIIDTLTEAGIEITSDIENIIDGAIAFVCYLLPHEIIEEEEEEYYEE